MPPRIHSIDASTSGIVEHDHRRLATELETHVLDLRGRRLHYLLANTIAAGEGNLVDARVLDRERRRRPAPVPFTMFSTPAGRPTSSAIAPSSSSIRGVISEGLSTTVQPAASAGRDLPRSRHERKVPRNDQRDDARWLEFRGGRETAKRPKEPGAFCRSSSFSASVA